MASANSHPKDNLMDDIQLINSVIELAWCDKTSFEDIYLQTGLSEDKVIQIMRRHLKDSSFRLWRKRVSGRIKKHKKLYQLKHKRYR